MVYTYVLAEYQWLRDRSTIVRALNSSLLILKGIFHGTHFVTGIVFLKFSEPTIHAIIQW